MNSRLRRDKVRMCVDNERGKKVSQKQRDVPQTWAVVGATSSAVLLRDHHGFASF